MNEEEIISKIRAKIINSIDEEEGCIFNNLCVKAIWHIKYKKYEIALGLLIALKEFATKEEHYINLSKAEKILRKVIRKSIKVEG